MKQEQSYDIIIVGSGLVATSLIVALQHQGLSVAVVENHLPQLTTQPKQDKRPLSLSYASYAILRTLGVWDDLAAHACPIATVHVSDEGALGTLCFQAVQQRLPALGYVVPFGVLQSALYRRACAQPGVEMNAINQLMAITCGAQGCCVTVKTARGVREITAPLLVAADGAHSTARELLNIASVRTERGDVALSAEIKLRAPHRCDAYQRFTRLGTLAILPLLERQCCRLVWSLSKDTAQQVMQWDDLTFTQHVQRALGRRIPPIAQIVRGQTFPLQTIWAREQVRSGVVLLGNAAHTLYPVAAQGYNLGLRDTAALAETLLTARQQLQSLGDEAVLRAYYHWRKSDQQRVASLTRGMTDLFSLQLPFLSKARGLGLLATELMPSLKQRLAKQLLGLAGRLPKLALGIALVDNAHLETA